MNWLFAVCVYLVGIFPLFLAGLAPIPYTLVVFGGLPVVTWGFFSWLGSHELGRRQYGWLVYLLALPLLLVFVPAGWVPWVAPSWSPVTWVPVGLTGMVLIVWLSVRLHDRIFETTVQTAFQRTNQFKLRSLRYCVLASGVVFTAFCYPLWLLRVLRLNRNPYLLAAWLLFGGLVAIIATGGLSQVEFSLDFFTAIFVSLWPLSLGGYLFLFPVEHETFFGQQHPFFNWFVEVGTYSYLFSGVIIAMILLGYLAYRGFGSRASRFFRPLVNSILIGGLILLFLAVAIVFMGHFVFTPPDFTKPDWSLESSPTAETNYRALHRFGTRLNYEWYELPRGDQFDTGAFLRDHADTVRRGKSLLSRKLQFPREYLVGDTTFNAYQLSALADIVKLKALDRLEQGNIAVALDQSEFLLQASENLLGAQAVPVVNFSALRIRNKALDIHERINPDKMSVSQARRLHQQLIDASRLASPPSNLFYTGVIYEIEHVSIADRRERLMKVSGADESVVPELWRLMFAGFQPGQRHRNHIIQYAYNDTLRLDSPYSRVNWGRRFKKQGHLLGYLLSYPRTPISSYELANAWPNMRDSSKQVYSSLSRARQQLHEHYQAFGGQLEPIPGDLKRDPMTGQSISSQI